jgi:hypothetical protein
MAAQAEDGVDDDGVTSFSKVLSDAVGSMKRVFSAQSTSNSRKDDGHAYSVVESNDQLELQHQPAAVPLPESSPQVPDTLAPGTSSGGDGIYLERNPSGPGAAQAEDGVDDDGVTSFSKVLSDAVGSMKRVFSAQSTSNSRKDDGHAYSVVESNDQLELQHQPAAVPLPESSPQVPDTLAPGTSSGGDGIYLERNPLGPGRARSGGGSTDASSSSQLVSDVVGSRTRVLSAQLTSNGSPNADDHSFSRDGQVELKVLTAAATPLQLPDTSVPETSSGGAGMHPKCHSSGPSCTRSGGGNQDNGTSIALPNPLCSSPGTRARRRLYLIALLSILISAGIVTVFVWRSHQVTDANGTNLKNQEREINSSSFFSPDANSSDFMALNHSYVSFLNSSRTAARSSCSYYSCSSCTTYVGCGWCVPSGRCSSGTEYSTSDSWCVGRYQGVDWIWYSSDCPSRCAVGSYSSTGNVCRPPLTTTLSLITDVSLVNPLPPSPFHRNLAQTVLLVVFNP